VTFEILNSSPITFYTRLINNRTRAARHRGEPTGAEVLPAKLYSSSKTHTITVQLKSRFEALHGTDMVASWAC